MTVRGKEARVFLSLAFLFVFSGRAAAERPAQGLGKWLQEAGIFAGYGQGDIKADKYLEVVPVGLRFGFDLKPFTKKFGLEPPGLLEVVYEPYIGAITQPRNNVEFALPVFLKYAYPLTETLYPYIEVGAGPYYMTLHTVEQSTQFNFVSAGGAGLEIFLKKDLAVNVGFRYRHVSNDGIKEPNSGMNAMLGLVGLSLYY